MRSAAGPIGARASTGGPRQGFSQPAQYGRTPQAAEIGALFRDLRRILQLSLPDLAARLGTRIEVVTALERGELGRLPPWPETFRIVRRFTGMAQIDPGPVLVIIRAHMEQGAGAGIPQRGRGRQLNSLAKATAAATARVVSTTRSAASVAWGARQVIAQSWIAGQAADMDVDAEARYTGAWLGRSGIMVLLVLSLSLATYLVRSAGMEGALTDLRAPISKLVTKAQGYVMRQTARVAGGSELKWIDVDDPRSRRGDRLQSEPR